MILGITGPIGAGKSTAVGIVRAYAQLERGHFVHVDLDRLGHLLLKDSAYQSELISAFGKQILGAEGIDRAALGAVAFQSKEHYLQLTTLAYPRLKAAVQDRLNHFPKTALIVIDGAVMNDLGLLEVCDSFFVILPDASRALNSDVQTRRRQFQPSKESYESLGGTVITNTYDTQFESSLLKALV